MRLNQVFEVTPSVRNRWRKILPWVGLPYPLYWAAKLMQILGWVPKFSPLIGLILSIVSLFCFLLFAVASIVLVGPNLPKGAE